MVQWLRLHAPNTGGPGSIPGQGTRSHGLQLEDSTYHSKHRRSHVPQLRPSAAKYIYIYTHTHTHTHTYIIYIHTHKRLLVTCLYAFQQSK